MLFPKFIRIATILAILTAVILTRTPRFNADIATSFLGNDDGDPNVGWDSEDPEPPDRNYGDSKPSVS
jgi:hypothetical protein